MGDEGGNGGMMEVVIGQCPKCGCPIYQEEYWAGSGHAPTVYICKCYQDAVEPIIEEEK